MWLLTRELPESKSHYPGPNQPIPHFSASGTTIDQLEDGALYFYSNLGEYLGQYDGDRATEALGSTLNVLNRPQSMYDSLITSNQNGDVFLYSFDAQNAYIEEIPTEHPTLETPSPSNSFGRAVSVSKRALNDGTYRIWIGEPLQTSGRVWVYSAR